MSTPPHRPARLSGESAVLAATGDDPDTRAQAAHATAWMIAHGTQPSGAPLDAGAVERVRQLAGTAEIHTLAQLWSDCPADTLPGALWRLYMLAAWADRDPESAARQFAAGRLALPVSEVIAGVAEPPGPDEIQAMITSVMSGLCGGDLADTLDRVAAFAHVAARGRVELHEATPDATHTTTTLRSAAQLLDVANALHVAAKRWRTGDLV